MTSPSAPVMLIQQAISRFMSFLHLKDFTVFLVFSLRILTALQLLSQFSERSMQTRLDFRFSSVFNFTESEWQIPSPCPPLAFNRSGRGERVTATVSSGNIWWARQTQKGSFETSRKRENVRIQEWAGWVWKVKRLLGWKSVKYMRKYARSLTRVLNDKYLFFCLTRLDTLFNVQ